MAVLDQIPHVETVAQHRPWLRAIVRDEGWQRAIDHLANGRCTLLSLWADVPYVHMALLEEQARDIAVVSYVATDGAYPSVAARHPAAGRLERAIRDLFGLEASGAPDSRPWLDLGHWDVRHPLGNKEEARPHPPYAFLPSEGQGLHQIAVGPIHAGIIEPGHFRFTANGERVVRLEQRLGWVHKGIESLMTGAPLMAAAKLAARSSGDSTVAYAYAFAQAAEAADGISQLLKLVAEARRTFPRLIELYDKTASLQDRTVTTGIVRPDYARSFGAGGYVGRASGRAFDARSALAYAPYGDLKFDVPVLQAGDVNARIWVRIREVEQSLALIEQILELLPAGGTLTAFEVIRPGEGMALAEAFRGDVLIWLRLDTGARVARCHLRDASWFQWPLLEAAVEDNIVADFPICNKSFNCSYSGHDL
jgi:Ni,Fe-hydrogenase III large subunit